MLNKPCGHAAHVDSVDRLRLPTLPPIAWTGLRPAHMTTRPVIMFFSWPKIQQRREVCRLFQL